MVSAIRHAIIGWKFRRMTRHFDRAKAEARRQHKPTRHIDAARTAFVHDALRGARRA